MAGTDRTLRSGTGARVETGRLLVSRKADAESRGLEILEGRGISVSSGAL